MFFWTLLLSHVIGDFPLQTDAVYRLKTKYRWGVLPHVAICTAINIIALRSILALPQAWAAIVFLAVLHIIFDRTKLTVSATRAGDSLLHFLVDQLLHVFSVWLAALWLNLTIPAAHETAVIPMNREMIINLTALITAAFAGVPVIYYVQKYWCEVKKQRVVPSYPTLIGRLPGYAERFVATLTLIMGGWWTAAAAAAFIPRLLINRNDPERRKIFISSAVGLAISLFCGLGALAIR